jgi:hypothetical protein
MSRSDRERAEGFHLSRSTAVAVWFAIEKTASERVEGFQLSGSLAVAVLSAVAVTTASERAEGFHLPGSTVVAVTVSATGGASTLASHLSNRSAR